MPPQLTPPNFPPKSLFVKSPRPRPRTFLENLEPRTLLSLTAPTSYNIGSQPDSFVPNAAPINVLTADFDRDGKLDLLVSHKIDNSLYFLHGNGNGTFLPAVQIPIGEAIEGRIFLGDFNNDGKLDIFLPGGSSQAVVLLGNGNGTFQPRIDSSSFAVSGYYPRGWTTGDFNNDGKLDVASTLPSNSSDAGRYTVLLGNGNGTFRPGIVGPAGILHYSRWASAADLNNDGKLDLAIADGQGTSGTTNTVELTILLGNGDGTFTLKGHYASPQLPDGTNLAATANPEDTAIADVNSDGRPDVIESDYDNTINVFLGNGDGTFQAARSINPGNYPRSVVPLDANHDGKIDLVVTNVGINTGGAFFPTNGAEPGSLALLLGNNDGTFQAPITYSPSVYPGWTAVGDFNADGYPDLATTQILDGHSVKVMLNLPSATNLPPTFAASPSASPSAVNGTTTTLSALGADDAGEPNLTYTWSTVGSVPATVTFSVNGTNAAKTTHATFTASGNYLFQAAVTDAAGLTIMDLVAVSVTITSSHNYAPFGKIDRAGPATFFGWAIDPTTSASAVTVRLDVDGATYATASANLSRPDLTPYYGSPNHGFTFDLTSLTPGFHRIDLFALDTTTSAPIQLGITSYINTNLPPTGWVDVLNSTTLAGWAFDPNAHASAIQLLYRIDSNAPTFATASLTRNDLTASLGSPNHGFNIALPQLLIGTHTVHAYAVDSTTRTLTLIGAGSFTTTDPPTNPLPNTNLDLLTPTRAAGWAWDRSTPTSSLNVRIDVDGATGTPFLANVPRPDVEAHVQATGSFGFDHPLSLTPGEHRIDIYALDTPSGTPVLFASRLIVAPAAAAAPAGFIDVASPTQIIGWAWSPTSPTSSSKVRIDIDGIPALLTYTNQSRPDLTPLYGAGTFGFTFTTPKLAPGFHTLHLYLLDPFSLAPTLLATQTLLIP